jgi:glutamyl-tRNA synthetase
MSTPTSTPARVRFAPSPTGYLHIGGLRTALYNYLLARQTGGAFILRVEDTDQKRFVADAEADIYASLAWAGLHPDEGPREGGPHGPYRQSERGRLYEEAIAQLIEGGHAYYAFDTEEALQAAREAAGGNFKYGASTRMAMRNSLSLSAEEVARLRASGAPHVVRLRCPDDETISFTDLIRGPVQFASEALDDQVLLKSDGLPTYHLANVVDDHDMGITHVIRGEEWLSSVPKHLLLYRYLGWTAPAMAHLPLIMNPKGGKLSKRDGAALGIPVLVHQYQEAGYAPEAVLNFLALLGWNPGTDEEVFSLGELTEAFDLSRVGSRTISGPGQPMN